MADRDVETIRDLIPRLREDKLLSVRQDYGPANVIIAFFDWRFSIVDLRFRKTKKYSEQRDSTQKMVTFPNKK